MENSTTAGIPRDLPKPIAGIIFSILLLLGIALRIYQHFIFGRSLWEDEAHLALNFMDGNIIDMFIPLKHFQSAPILFLLSEEIVTTILGSSEIALRSFPFFVSLFIYPLFYYAVRDAAQSRLAGLIAFALLTFSATAIHYSSETKPYTIELSVFIGMLYLLFSQQPYIALRREKMITIWGCIIMFLANTSLVVLTCIIIYRVYSVSSLSKTQQVEKRQQLKKQNSKLFKIWGITFAADIILNIIINPYADNLRELWTFSYIPINIFSSNFVIFMQQRIDEIFFSSMFFFGKFWFFSYVLLALLIAGMVNIVYNKRYHLLCFTILPVFGHMFLSWAQLYPLYFRFVLYLFPPIMMLIAISVTVVAVYIAKKLHWSLSMLPVAYILYCALLPSIKEFPIGEKDIRPVLAQINRYPANTQIMVTTPGTLYEYYYKRGYTKNKNFTALPWSVQPQQYFDTIKNQHDNYLLLYSANGYADGYAPVLKELKDRQLMLKTFEYGTYGVAEVRSLENTTPQQ